MVHDHDVIADAHDHPHVVFDEQHAQPEVGAEPADERGHLGGLVRVHPGRRLVEQQQGRLVAQRTGELEAPLVAVRQVLGELVLPATEPDQAQQLAGPLGGALLLALLTARGDEVVDHVRAELQVHADEHVLERRHVLEQPDVLEGAAHPGRHDVVRAGAAQDAEAGQEDRVPGRADGRDHEGRHERERHADGGQDDPVIAGAAGAEGDRQHPDEQRRNDPQDRLEPDPARSRDERSCP